MTKPNHIIFAVAVFLFCAADVVVAPSQVLTTLVNFDVTNGFEPEGVLAQGSNAKLYGTTFKGGTVGGINGLGTIFEVAPAGVLTTLDSFGYKGDPAGPAAGVLLSTGGDLYGTTFGADTGADAGTIFRITAQGELTILYSFCPLPCADGAYPTAPLVQATDGNFYGTTYSGGANSEGTIFRITPSGVLTTLHSFDDSGANPASGLIQATDGNLYGTTSDRGSFVCGEGCGSVFRITLDGEFATIHQFDYTDGAYPLAGLAEGGDGALYGVTPGGGTGCSQTGGCGTVFRITRRRKFQVVHNFRVVDGAYPTGTLTQGSDGRLYGTTRGGGDTECYYPGGIGCGTLFAISQGGTLTTLHKFDASDGNQPVSGLVQATNGTFYGTTWAGGSDGECFFGCGTLFSLDMKLGPFVTFVRFAGRVGDTGPILGQGFIGTSSVMLNGIPTSFTVVSDTFIKATVPPGATTGYVTVTTPTGILTSNVPFHVIQ